MTASLMPRKKTNFFPADTILEIVGNVASGKTTTARTIARKTTFEYVDIDVYAKNPFLESFVVEPKRWTFTSDLYFSYIRSQQIPEMVKKMNFSPVVLDSNFDMGIYVYSKNCFVEGKMTKDEWEFFQKLHSHLIKKIPTVHATVFIQIPTDEIMKRIVRRGRPHEQEYSRKYVENLQKRLDEYKKDLTGLKTRKIVATYHQLEKRLEFHTKEDKKLKDLFALLG